MRRIAHRLTLVALTAIAATALAASTAAAQQETVEVGGENVAEHCPPLVPLGGGCLLHVSGELDLRVHAFGIEVTLSQCVAEFVMTLDEDGTGRVEGGGFDHHPNGNCTRDRCQLPWATKVAEAPLTGLTFETRYCMDPDDPSVIDGDEQHCHFTAPLVDTGDHDYEILYQDLAGTPFAGEPPCELDGSLHFEDLGPGEEFDEVEIIHLG